MTSSWRQKAEAALAIIQPVARKKAMRPAVHSSKIGLLPFALSLSKGGSTGSPRTGFDKPVLSAAEGLTMNGIRHSSKRGFTLIELIVVMLILAILVGIVIISIGGVIGRGQQTAYDGDDESIRIAVTTYYVAYTEWPTDDGEWGIIAMGNLTAPPDGELPYLDTSPQSASAANCDGCTGHYTWSVREDARVTSICSDCPDGTGDGFQGVYP